MTPRSAVRPASSLETGAMLREALALLMGRVRAVEEARDHLAACLEAVERERDRWRRRAERLDVDNDRLKAELEEARRAAKRQAAPFGRRRRRKHPKRPGRPAGHAAARRPLSEKGRRARLRVQGLTPCPTCGGPVEDIRPLVPQYVDDITEPPDPRHRVLCYHNRSGLQPALPQPAGEPAPGAVLLGPRRRPPRRPLRRPRRRHLPPAPQALGRPPTS